MRIVYCILILSGLLPVASMGVASLKSDNKPLLINGAGASFPYILYSKWFLEYRKINPGIRINYRSIGSGGGIRQFLTGTLDFGATDVPMPKEQIQKSKKEILHLPTALGAVVVSYNLPAVEKKEIRLTASVLANIYMGKITKWNHKEISEINPDIALPDQNIVPVYRADGSGTTAVFTEYLAQFSSEWLQKVGKGKSVNWLTGIGGKGNEGVMGLIRKMPGAIGYVAMSYAVNRQLPMAEIQNMSGHFVKASTHTVKTSAQQILEKTNDLFHPLTAVQGTDVYPMSSYTYLLVYKEMTSDKGAALVQFLNWYLKNGQSFCESLHYIPLPSLVIQKVKHRVRSIKVTNDDRKT
ncbi:MAG: phosphate ABC transporter substrate-binding protein PstS [Bdellovibrionales bacterium]|nr:phosphate ABC transporter substrate-binding protein PstS [Bdellovibrionales bacterium]